MIFRKFSRKEQNFHAKNYEKFYGRILMKKILYRCLCCDNSDQTLRISIQHVEIFLSIIQMIVFTFFKVIVQYFSDFSLSHQKSSINALCKWSFCFSIMLFSFVLVDTIAWCRMLFRNNLLLLALLHLNFKCRV